MSLDVRDNVLSRKRSGFFRFPLFGRVGAVQFNANKLVNTELLVENLERVTDFGIVAVDFGISSRIP